MDKKDEFKKAIISMAFGYVHVALDEADFKYTTLNELESNNSLLYDCFIWSVSCYYAQAFPGESLDADEVRGLFKHRPYILVHQHLGKKDKGIDRNKIEKLVQRFVDDVFKKRSHEESLREKI